MPLRRLASRVLGATATRRGSFVGETDGLVYADSLARRSGADPHKVDITRPGGSFHPRVAA